MESSLTNYLLEHSFISIVMVVVVIFIVVGIIKSLFRIAIVLSAIGLVLVTFFGFQPDQLLNQGKDLTNSSSWLESNIATGLLNQLQDGGFLLKSENGDTIIEIDALGVSYNLNDLLSELGTDEPNDSENTIIKQ
ncbi:hypothetical protein [Radiobacillus sp. PE A8.2]|uniref:hypothetical protein n=1 Tax=Radiobacillus sp. PE A8.2 TaxID=3380349 RepID=UPI00388F7749